LRRSQNAPAPERAGTDAGQFWIMIHGDITARQI
jgi:hypothetical protein